MNEMRKLMEAIESVTEDADQNFNDDFQLRQKVEKIVVPQIEDDGNPEEWLQLMSYAFDDLDVPFHVGVAKTLLRDYGIKPHCDIEKRFGGSIDEELEAIGEDEFTGQGKEFKDSNEYISTIASKLRKIKAFGQSEYEQAHDDMQQGVLHAEDAVASLGLLLDDIIKLVDVIDNSSIKVQRRR